MNVLYTASATATSGRDGHVRTASGALNMNLVIPKELGGSGEVGTNPEELFAAGYAACFASAVRFLAQQQKKQINGSSVTARVSIGMHEGGGFGLAAELDVSITGISKEDAESLVAAAHDSVCPYSSATRGNIDVKVKLV